MYWAELPDLARYSAIGAGCGIGQDAQTAQALKRLLQTTPVPLVLDADALNILGKHPNWFAFLPKNTVLTPHPKEFERLFGPSTNDFERNTLQRAKAQELGVFIVLKGANTAIACPDGACWFNSTGNPGMATGGSGDVLTGILTGLLAQGYAPRDACLLGVFLHGLAGDLAAAEKSRAGLLAGDITGFLGKAWIALES
jgi:NAD(P)H-hydrate epimerase